AAFEIVPIAIEPRVTLSPAAFTYDGTAKVPKVEVWDGESVLVEGTDYDIALPDGRKNVGTYTVTIALKGIYAGSANATFEITAKETTPTVVLSPAKYTYNGAVKTPKVTVKDGADVLVAGEDCDITLPGGRKDAGTYKVKAVLKGNYSGSGSANITIAKAANTLVAKGKTVKVSASKLKSKSVKLTRKKTMKISKAKGTLSYKLGGVSKKKFKKYFKVNAKNGAITVKKNLKKGTYKVKVKVKAAGTKNYKAKTKTVTVTVRVK
ncbi:MAG: MBG domain-containing protein, partial [Coriobacteriia bacterium]|nr:MBG domain-containing protein [Coriobacteriia bacterium]